MNQPPPLTPLSTRAEEIVDAARVLLENDGPQALTLRAVAERLGIRAPSLYKHMPDKAALEAALIERGLLQMGAVLHAAAAAADPDALTAVLTTYRAQALAHPNMYRLATAGRLPRERLGHGIEEWSGEPFFLVTGDPYRSQALWSFAHGMVILEIDGRFPGGSDLDRTWAEGIAAFG